MNAATDGLFSLRPMLLPGESKRELVVRIEAGFAVFEPANAFEAGVVVGLIYTQQKISRLDRIEHRRNLVRLEEELMKTPAFKNFSLTQRALTAVNALAAAVEQTHVPPESLRKMDGFINGVNGTLEILRDVGDLPLAVIAKLEDARAKFEASSQSKVSVEAFAELGRAARDVGKVLATRLKTSASALEGQRKAIAADALLLKDSDVKSIDRHRRMLETSMARQLEMLKAAKEQIKASKPGGDAGNQDYRLRLRVVK